ncbi:hypothetical protein LTR36_006437 [Oleoguttula mirabilis]|uniref:P-loop containing nucleoside triphosphate hydrolase protein n=1 Tax=Oleoguttula mirabilis TaxID=1507867 RepID=A0AAV9JWI5_9PEZI|nr:hypothetical protein LTR36_006437 [Oleoguttula mirabilis]
MSPKLLILGLPRTGSHSIADAVQQLGHGPVYHMRDVGKLTHLQAWIKLLDKKFPGSPDDPIRTEELDEILAPYNTLADFPATIFAKEIIRAYPEAKVVLTVRDEDAWYESTKATLWHQFVDPQANKASPMRLLAEKYHQYCWASDFPTHGRKYFGEYYEHVRAVVRSEQQVIEYNVKDGWGPLCEFLGEEVPAGPFPRRDNWLVYKLAHRDVEA